MLKRVFNRLFTLTVLVLHPKLNGRKRWYLKLYYKSVIKQSKFFFKDRFFKKPYKQVFFFGEFAPELKFVLPYAYWHYLNGTLAETTSSRDTKCFYFFSPEHREETKSRSWDDFNFDLNLPNVFDHGVKYDYRKWRAVPLKEVYSDTKITFDKPSLIISNKYNSEWDGPPVNYFSTEVLEILFSEFSNKFQIIYNRPRSTFITGDNSLIQDLNEENLFKKYTQVINLNEMFEGSGEESFNSFQLRVYAGCERFLSVQGGNSVLASYFGGVNIIYAVSGLELEMGEYDSIFPKLSNARIIPVGSYDICLQSAKEEFLKELACDS